MAAPKEDRPKEPAVRRAAVVAYTEYEWDPRVRRETEALVEAGYVVHVLSLRPKAGLSSPHIGGVHVHELPLTARRGGKARYAFQYGTFCGLATARLLGLHLSRPLDIVHIHSLPDFLVFAAVPLKLRGVPILLDLHEAMPEIVATRMHMSTRSLLVRVARSLERASTALADHVIVANDGIRAAIVARGCPESKITTIYNAGEIAASEAEADGLRERLALPDGKLVVHAGGLNPERDLETLLRAFARVSAVEAVCLVIAGDGEPVYRDKIARLADRLGLSARVRFVGRLSLADAHRLMSLSSVGLVTLESNPLTELSWPTRIAEFASLGKPLIVPDLRFVREVLGDAARYYKPGDPESLARHLGDVLRLAPAQNPTVERAKQVSQLFAWPRMRHRLIEVFHRLEEIHAG